MQPEDNQNNNQPPMDSSQYDHPEQQYVNTPPSPQPTESVRQQYQPVYTPLNPEPIIPVTPTTNPGNAYPASYTAPPTDPISIYIEKIKKNPGKSLLIGALALSLFSTILPWVGPVFSANSSNYYGLIGKNMFAILYIFELAFIAFYRYTLWFSLENFKPYKETFDYLEILCAGGILMFTFALGVYDNIQIGLVFSVLANIGIVAYLSYIRFYKNTHEDNTSNINN